MLDEKPQQGHSLPDLAMVAQTFRSDAVVDREYNYWGVQPGSVPWPPGEVPLRQFTFTKPASHLRRRQSFPISPWNPLRTSTPG